MSSASKLIIVLFCTFLCVPIAHVYSQKSTGINNTNPNPKAALDVSTTGTQGVFIPRLPSAATKTALSPIASDAGLTFYGSDDNTFWYWNGTQWLALLSGTTNSGPWTKSGINVLLTTATDNVGIGITPTAKFDIGGSVANNIQAIFTRGNGDQNFQLYAANGVASNASGTVQGQFGLRYAGVGDAASFTFIRGNGTQDASIVFNTNAAERMRINALGGIQIAGLAGAGNSLIQTDASGTLSRYSGTSLAGTGTVNQIAYWTSSNTMSATNSMYWDATNKRLGIGTATPTNALDVAGGMVVGAGYAGVTTAPTNGLAVQGIASIGATSPFGTLNVDFLAFGNREIKLINSGFAHWSIINNATGAFQIGTSSSVSSIGAPVGSFFYISPSGYVGIGIASPAYALDVVGNARISGLVGPGVVTASSAGLLSVTPGTPVVGAGTTNYITKWTPSGSALGSSIMYDNGTSVGIGTTTPAYLFTLVGTGSMFAVDNTASFVAKNATGTYENYLWPRWSDNAMYMNYGTGGLYIRNNASTTTMFMTNTGNVGIGTTAPVAKLHIVGADWNGSPVTIEGTGSVGPTVRFKAVSHTYDIISTDAGAGAGAGNLTVYDNTVGAYRTVLNAAGNFGIGITSPAARLDVFGSGSATVDLKVNGRIQTGDANNNGGIWLSSAQDGFVGNNGASVGFYGSGIGWGFGMNKTTGATTITSNSSYPLYLSGSSTWGTATQIYNSSSGGSTYNIVSTGSSHTLGAGSFTIEDGTGNIFYAINSAKSATYISPNSSITTGIGYPATTTLNTSYKLNVNGGICATTFVGCSDERYKQNISLIGETILKLRMIKGVYYYWRRDEFPDMEFSERRQVGVIAQEIEKYYPEVVYTGDNGYKTVDYPKLTPILLQGLKELDEVVQTQELKINKLEYENKVKQNEIGELKAEINSIKEFLKLNTPESNTVKAITK